MDIKTYIESGIIEGYVLGTISDQERREVECMSSIYPELKQHLSEIQTSFETFVSRMAITPPQDLKYAIMESIAGTEQDLKPGSVQQEIQQKAQENAKIVQMNTQGNVTSFWRMLAAACLLLLVGTTALFIDQAMRKSDLEKNMAQLEKDQQKQQEETSKLQAQIDQREKEEQFILAESTTEIHLTGTEKNPGADVLVLFNADQKAAMLSFNGLPKPAQDKQYQMWLIIDGKPVDLGVLERDPKEKVTMMDLESILKDSINISAIAITLEKVGGNSTPTMDELFVIANI